MSWHDIAAFSRQFWVVWLVVIFIGIVFYAYRPKNRKHFDDCAQIPFRDGGEEKKNHG